MKRSAIFACLAAGLTVGLLTSATDRPVHLPEVSATMAAASGNDGCPNEKCKSVSSCETKEFTACLISYVPAQRCDTELCAVPR